MGLNLGKIFYFSGLGGIGFNSMCVCVCVCVCVCIYTHIYLFIGPRFGP